MLVGMATRKEAKRKSLIQVLVLIVAVVVVAVATLVFQNWWQNRPGAEPSEITVHASVGDREAEITPYLVCELGEECPEGEVNELLVDADETLRLEIPEEIYSTQWRVLQIYDDPAANDEILHGSYDTDSVEISGSVDDARLLVVEISTVVVGTDDEGEETPYSVVWSISTMDGADLPYDEEGATADGETSAK